MAYTTTSIGKAFPNNYEAFALELREDVFLRTTNTTLLKLSSTTFYDKFYCHFVMTDLLIYK